MARGQESSTRPDSMRIDWEVAKAVHLRSIKTNRAKQPVPVSRLTLKQRKRLLARKCRGEASSSGGIGLLGVLGVVFVTLKLCGLIHWSWWWVLLPFYGPVSLFLMFLGGLFVLGMAAAAMTNDARKVQRAK